MGLLLDYAPGIATREVPDPYYTGDYDGAIDLITMGVDGLIASIRAGRIQPQ